MFILVISIFVYSCESWPLIADTQRSMEALQMRYHRKILNISYIDPMTNEEILKRITEAFGLHDIPLNIVTKRKKIMWYGHVTRPSCLAKTFLQGTLRRERKESDGRGRGGKITSGNEQACFCFCFFAESQSAADDRDKWWVVGRESFVVQQGASSP